jgi:aspartate/glutamate racemase
MTIESGLYSEDKFTNKTISISELTCELQYELDVFLQRADSMFPNPETVYEFSALRAKILNFFKSQNCNVILLACTDLDELFQNITEFQLYSTRILFAELLSNEYFHMEGGL